MPISNTCLQGRGAQGDQCDDVPGQVRMFGFMGMMILTLILWAVCCYDDYKYNKKINAPRKNESKPNAPTEHKTAKDFHREKAETIFNHSTAIVEAFDKFERLQNTEQIAIAADVMDVVGLYRLIALATVNVTHVDGSYKALKGASINPIDEVMLRMEKTQSDIEYVLDGVNKLDARKAALPGLKTALLKTIDRHPYPLDGRPLIDAVASGNYVLHSEAFRSFESRTLSLLPVFESAASMVDVNTFDPKPASAPWFPLLQRYWIAYLVFWALCLAAFVTMAIDSGIGGSTELFDMQGPSNITGLSGMGKSFFPIPPQYTFEVCDPVTRVFTGGPNVPCNPSFETQLIGGPLHTFSVPFIYGVMHAALTGLGFVPVPLCRGMIRDLIHYVPFVKRVLPVDQIEEVHRQLGYFTLACIASGALIWIITMGSDCLNHFRDTCLAFDPIVNNFSDPTENVLVLRFVIWSTWFTFLPIMQFAFRPAPLGLSKIEFIAKWWYEICFFGHYLVTVVGLVIALIG
jgi:hypothetical protein